MDESLFNGITNFQKADVLNYNQMILPERIHHPWKNQDRYDLQKIAGPPEIPYGRLDFNHPTLAY